MELWEAVENRVQVLLWSQNTLRSVSRQRQVNVKEILMMMMLTWKMGRSTGKINSKLSLDGRKRSFPRLIGR